VTRYGGRHGVHILLVLLSSVALGLWTTGAAAQRSQRTRLNYVNADLRAVIRSLAAALGRNVLLAGVPATRITFSTPEPVSTEELGGVLESILEAEGLVLVDKGPVAQVLPADRAPATGAVRVGKELPSPPPLGLITQLVPLEFMRADEGLALLKQIASPTARIEVVPRSNSLLITDRGRNVARYLELLRQLDARTGGEAGLRTYVYNLKHANAAELAATLGQLFGTAVVAAAPRAREEALDERGLSRTLETFRRRDEEALEQRRAMPQPVQPQPAEPQVPEPQPGEDTVPPAGQAPEALVGQTTIVPDPATNSLVIRTQPPNFPVLQETIQALDVRPPQVLLEVLIAEVTLDRATQYGIDWSVFTTRRVAGRPADITGRFGPQQFSDTALAGVQDFVLRITRLNNIDVRAVLRALASRSNVRVLSTPHVLALNNETARILVGSEVPFSQSTRSGLDVVVDRIVQFRNVGTQLSIVPTINTDGYVTFRILQEVSGLTTQTVEAALNAPIITVREAETSAIVRNGQTIVIGGLIDEATERVESGVPILKDIPLLGLLFKNQTVARSRTELAIFLTPHVVLTDEDARRILNRERARMRGFRGDTGRVIRRKGLAP
jgi:general secretion pathway protein D